MLSLDGAITLGGRKQPLNERRPSSAKVILFENRCGSIPRWGGGGCVNVEGGGGVYVKYWPSGGWALARTGALTRENTVYLERDIVSKTRCQVYLDLDIRQVIFLNIYN